MAKSGLFSVIEPVPPVQLTPGNAQALRIWNDLAGELRWPDLLYVFTLHEVTEPALMLARLYVLRDLMKPARANG